MFNFLRKNEKSTDKFLRYMKANKPHKALPVIEEIIRRAPHVGTSHFNHGVCLSALKRYNEAAEAFFKAYEIKRSDGGALYRACISLAEAENPERLYEVFAKELAWNPFTINKFVEEEKFHRFFGEEKFLALKNEYKDYIGKEES